MSLPFLLKSKMPACIAAGFLFCHAGAAESLYLLSGTAFNGMNLPIRLYRLDRDRDSLELVREVATGLTCVLTDYDKRRMVVASPALEARDFYVIDMNNPDKATVRHADYDTRQLVPGFVYLLDMPGDKFGVALFLQKVVPPDRVETPRALTYVSLDEPGLTTSLPFDSLRYARAAGEVGGGLNMLETRVIVRGDPLRVTVSNKDDRSDTGMRRPPYLKLRDPGEGFTLVANDTARAVIVPSEPGVADILNKASGEWRRVPIPFADAKIRPFGPWLAMIELRSSGVSHPNKTTVTKQEISIAHHSPGSEKRLTEPIGESYRREPAPTVESVFENFEIGGGYLPGELALYNVESGVQLRISTGSGDSEIVLITENAVYYRVDDALYRRHISGSSLSNPVKLAEGEEIVQVHWAFLANQTP
jgi:hypothetical protein